LPCTHEYGSPSHDHHTRCIVSFYGETAAAAAAAVVLVEVAAAAAEAAESDYRLDETTGKSEFESYNL
jgi:hypothetical protein